MAELHFRPGSELWPLVDRAFQYHSREIRLLVPAATVEHIGATSIPGALTKGDVDLLVRVPPEAFPTAADALRGRYAAAEPTAWSAALACFSEERDGEPPVGVQLVAAGSAEDGRLAVLRRLLRRTDVVERLNELKRQYEGRDPGAYEAAKQAMYSELLDERDEALREQPGAERDQHAGDGRGAVPAEPAT